MLSRVIPAPGARIGAALLTVVLLAVPASAQSPDAPVGARAQGMAGAFVAVADDGSAPFWNAAGLSQMGLVAGMVSGSSLGVKEDSGEPVASARNAWSHNDFGLAFGLPALAFSYARAHTEAAAAVATAEPGPDRQDPGTAALVRRTDISQFGVSVAQAIGDRVVVGSTLRLVRGEAARTLVPASLPAASALDRAKVLAGTDRTRFDADIGVLAYAGVARIGVSFRHLAEPTLLDADGELAAVRLERAVRAGVAFGTGRMWNQQPWTIAIDADLTRQDGPDGERQAVAIGAERWFRNRRAALRGGGEWQVVGERRPLATAGGTIAVRSGLYLDAYLAAGSDIAGRGWGVAARFAY